MFVIACLGVLCVAYFTCALISQLLLDSPQEASLPASARVGVGALWLFTFFAAGWQLFSPAITWATGLVLLAAWLGRRLAVLASARWWRDLVSQHWRTFAACVAIALIFFAPLASKQRFGPFTEGGGDVNIYADSALYLDARALSARGTPASTWADFEANVREVLDSTIDADLSNRRAMARYEAADAVELNPPSAENATYRAVVMRSFSPLLYAPYVAFAFLAGATNYHVYYGLQAFIYALVIVCGWAAFRRWGRAACLLYAALLLLSHSLVSIPYNTYSAQTIAVFSCVLLLCLVLHGLRPWTPAGVRTIAIPFVFMALSYAHYLSILVPLAALALLVARDEPASAPAGVPRGAVSWASFAVFGVLLLLLLWGGSDQAVRFIRDNIVHRLGSAQNVFLGERAAAFSFTWLEWLFGFVSQQHVAPLAQEVVRVNQAIEVGLGAVGVAAVAGTVLAVWRVREARARAARFPADVGALLLLAAIATLHVFSAQAYVYTQAKGAQNVIPVIYACFVIVATMAVAGRRGPALTRAASYAALAAILAFALALAVPRAVFGWKLGMGQDRATILEPSFFEEARRVTNADPRALTLFEPRKSADLYVSVEPFFGSRVVPTRHLALQRVRVEGNGGRPQRLDASFFVQARDVPNIWFLAAHRGGGGDTWTASRVGEAGVPALFLFADDYDAERSARRVPGSAERGRFSWLRNGSTVVYLPPGGPHRIEAAVMPVEASQLAALRDDLSKHAANGDLANARIEERAGGFMLAYDLPASAEARMARVALFTGEYWVNVRVDGSELRKSPRIVAAARISAVPGEIAGTQRPVRISWSVDEPDSQDWVGIFPEGGEDDSRVAFRFTGGGKSGEMELAVPAASRGAFEARFFRAGTWNAAETARFVLDSP
jgi:hypothetical protein